VRVSSLVPIWFCITLVTSDATAQGTDDVMIARAAVTYALRNISPTKLVIDGTTLHGDSAVAGQLAKHLAGNVGRASDYIHCESREADREGCSIPVGTVIVAFARPMTRADYAELVVSWWYQAVPGHVTEKMLKLALRRSVGLGWQVTDELVSGRS
jgi:hypothetical protein